MARLSPKQLVRTIKKLRAERQTLAARLAELDSLFGALDTPATALPHSVTAEAPKVQRGRRKRGRFAETAEQFVLGLLNGKKLTGAEINAAWKTTGRAGTGNNTLTKLFKAKQVKRVKAKGARGGTYSVA